MARRHIEAEIQCGQDILGQKPSDKWESVKLIREIKTPTRRQGLFCVQFSFEGDKIALGYGNGAVDLYDVKSGSLSSNLREARYGGYQVMCIRFCPRNTSQLFITTSEGHVYVADVEGKECKLSIMEAGNEINSLDFCKDGYVFATAGKDLGVRAYDTKTLSVIREWESGHDVKVGYMSADLRLTMRNFCLKFHTVHDELFVTGGWENQLKIWDVRLKDGVARYISGPHICGDAIDMKGDLVLTGSWIGNNALQLWNFTEGTLRKNIPFPHGDDGEFLYSSQLAEGNTVLAGGSGTNSVEAINMDTGQHLGGVKMKKSVMAMDSTFGGRLFAVAGHDPILKLALIT